MNPFEMVVLIVAITAVAGVLRAKYGVHGHRVRRRDRGYRDEDFVAAASEDNDRLRDEVRQLKERIAVLERIATDANGRGASLEREIESLRDRP